MSKVSKLSKEQRDHLAWLCEEYVENNSYDWQLPVKDHNEGITWYSDMLRALGFKKRAKKLDKEYMLT